MREVSKPKFATKTIEKVLAHPEMNTVRKFLNWYSAYYGNGSGMLYGQFLPNYVTVSPKVLDIHTPEAKELVLSPAQEKAVEQINDQTKPTILHGVTGSGKTRIYIDLIIRTLKSGRSALLLYPEISLTPQIVEELSLYAPLIVFHSQLSDAERSSLWHTVALSTQPHVVVGPRSALFLPHTNLGLIVIDEAHEASYKQDSDIHYNGLHTAAGLANTHNAKLVLGSATSPVTETEQIVGRGGKIICLHEKAIQHSLDKDVQIIDIRKKELFKKHSLLSDALLSKMQLAIKEKRQTLLFINRRGTAKLVVCSSPDCDWQATCDSCELPMTFHHDTHTLICHTCARKKAMPHNCPVCSSDIQQKVFGSKAFVEDVQKLFPQARIARFDSDNQADDTFASKYEDVVSGKYDILIGTQQLVKGLDLPKLSVVGVLNADLSLHFPDYSSEERTFQLITQVLGRVGRGHQASHIILQTRQPNNPIIRYSIDEDWHAFNASELANRKQHNFPPYVHLAKLLFRDSSMTNGFKKAELVNVELQKMKTVHVDGPLLSFFAKRGNNYYVQLHLRAAKRSEILKALAVAPKGTISDIDPNSLL